MKIYVPLGLLVVAVVLGLTLWSNQGSRLILEGSIQKVRLQKVEDSNTVAVVEFRLNNPADYPYFVKTAELMVEDAKGARTTGILFRKSDLKSFFDFYKGSLGQQFNESVYVGQQLASHKQADLMIAASFPLTVAELEERKRLVIKLEPTNSQLPTEIAEIR